MNIVVNENCPRCGGQVYIDVDEYGPYKGCLPCGWMEDIKLERPVTVAVTVPAEGKAHLKEEAVRRRLEGEPEALVAAGLGVSTRQVRYWCQGVDGIERNAGNRCRVLVSLVRAGTMTLEQALSEARGGAWACDIGMH